MKKVIFAFAAGQALQLVILLVGMSITYTENLFVFCAAIGIGAALMLLIGSVLSAIEAMPTADADMDEVSPIPEEIRVENDKVVKEATVDQLFGKRVKA